MECRKCKKPLEEGWKVCPWCVTPIQPEKRKQQKRANGTGGVYKRGKTWTARVTTHSEVIDGKVRQHRITKGGFATKTAAVNYLSSLQEQKAVRVAPSLEFYYAAYSSGKMEKLSESKYTAYKIAYNKMTSIKNKPINEITVKELQALIHEKCPTYYPAKDMRQLLTNLYKMAAAEGWVSETLPSLLELPQLEEEEREPFTEDEQKALWASYESGENEYASIPLIMIYTGMMTGEMRKLTAEMVNLDMQEIDSSVGLKTKVRKKSSILLPESIIPVFEDVLSKTPTGLLYPVNETKFYELYYGALEKAGTRRLTPYSCRHTAATALTVDEKIAPQIVKRLMRWSSTRMMDRYVHPSDDDARAAVNKRKKAIGDK